jgi:multidrug efflux pump subunit AcrA (membrane-fusion protein)
MKILQNRKIIIIAVALVIVAVTATVLYVRTVAAAKNTLTASGTVETTQVSIAAEATGKIQTILVQEGGAVKSGEDLFELDDTVIQAQRKAAVAKLEAAKTGVEIAQNAQNTAEAQYQIALEAALAKDEKSRLQDWFSKDPKQFDQPGWYFTRTEQIKAAQQQVDQAKTEMKNAQTSLDELTNSMDKANFLDAEQRLLNARLSYLITRKVKDRSHNSSSANQPVGKYNSDHCGTNQGYRLATADLTNTIYACEGDPQLSGAGAALYDNSQT